MGIMGVKKEDEESKTAEGYILKTHPINPFLSSMYFKLNMIVSESNDKRTPKDNIVYYKGEEYRFLKYFEAEKPTKLYGGGELMELLSNNKLTPDACRILLYIVCKIGEKSSSVHLSADIMQNELGYSKTHYQDYLKELVRHRIIAKRSKSLYWVNPMIFFRGNRYERFAESGIASQLNINKEEVDHFDPEELIVGKRFVLRNDIYLQAKDGIDRMGSFYVEKHLSMDIEDIPLDKEIDTFLRIENGIQFTENGPVNLAVQSRVANILLKLKKVRSKMKKIASLNIPKLGK